MGPIYHWKLATDYKESFQWKIGSKTLTSILRLWNSLPKAYIWQIWELMSIIMDRLKILYKIKVFSLDIISLLAASITYTCDAYILQLQNPICFLRLNFQDSSTFCASRWSTYGIDKLNSKVQSSSQGKIIRDILWLTIDSWKWKKLNFLGGAFSPDCPRF